MEKSNVLVIWRKALEEFRIETVVSELASLEDSRTRRPGGAAMSQGQYLKSESVRTTYHI
jgi:hypothetical protein